MKRVNEWGFEAWGPQHMTTEHPLSSQGDVPQDRHLSACGHTVSVFKLKSGNKQPSSPSKNGLLSLPSLQDSAQDNAWL